MAFGLARHPIKSRIIDLIKAALADHVYVGIAAPPEIPNESIILYNTVGPIEHNAFGGGALPRDDTFTVRVGCFARVDGQTADDACARAETLANVVVETIAANTELDEQPGDGWMVLSATTTAADGPDPYAGPNGEGWISVVTVELTVHYRITTLG